MRKFDYSFLEFNKIPGNLINVLTSIYSMKSSNDNRKENFRYATKKSRHIGDF